MLAAAVVCGGLLTKTWNAFWQWIRGNYRSKEELRDEEFRQLKLLVEKTVAACNQHFQACNETPNKVILDEITNLTNVVSAHISDDKGTFNRFTDSIDKLRDDHSDALGQILTAVKGKRAQA